MSVFIRSTERASTQRARWRSVIAVGIVAGLATIGMTAVAAPAAAEEAGPAVVDATTPAGDPSGTGGPPGLEKKGEPAAPEDTGEPAAPDDTGEPAVPEDAGEAAAPEDTPTAPIDESAPAVTTEEPAADSAVALLVPPGDEVVPKVEICHGTASYKHPYEINEPAADGDVSGHAGHTGPIFWPDIPKHTQWGDIIPPFFYGDPANPSFFPGLNWTPEGEAIFANDCEIPTPEPDLFVFPESCRFYFDFGTLEVEVGPVQENVDYRVTILDSEGNLAADGFISEETGTASLFWILPPGDYTITLEQSIIEGEWELLDEQFFTILGCPVLDVSAVATGCSLGDDGSATVSLSGLIPGESYEWFLAGNQYDNFGTLIADAESTDLPFDDLPPGNYEFTIAWPGGVVSQEGGSSIAVAEPEVLSAHATFFVEPCQPSITVEVTECAAFGDDGSATLTLTDLVTGPFGAPEDTFIEYEVWVTAQGDEDGTVYGGISTVIGDADHEAEVAVASLTAGKSYTAWVHGTWTPPGGWGEVKEFELHASADFSQKPCPAAPVTPAGLAVTGAGDPGDLVAAALILFGLGGAALVARGRRRAGSYVDE